jgi:GT2 family glycosyltransferase
MRDRTNDAGETPPAVSVLIVNYNSGGRLRRCLQCLGGQTFRDFEIVVFDNGSDDSSVHEAQGAPLDFQLVEAHANLGFAAANNRAAERARGEWLAFLNPDAYPEPDWLEELLAATRRHPFADAFGSTQIDARDPSRLDGAGDVYSVFGVPWRGHFGWPVEKLPPEGECFSPCAAAALFRKRTFLDLGGFDERFFCYGEDVDLGFRLRLAGGRCVQAARARVLHEGSGVTGRRSAFSIYHGHRNRIWTAYKNTPAALYWPLLPLHALAHLALFVRAALSGQAGAYARALRDGYSRLPQFAADRRKLRSSRKARLSDIARTMCWSPLALLRRRAVLRPADESHAMETAN